MTFHTLVLLLAAIVDQAAAASLRGAAAASEQPKGFERQRPTTDGPEVEAEFPDYHEEDEAAGEISLVQLDASLQTKVGRQDTQGQLDVASTFRRAVEGALDGFESRVAIDVSGDVSDGYAAADTKEAAASLAVLEEVGVLKAEILDLQEQLGLLVDDERELKVGLKELEKNVTMAKEFSATAKTGLYGAPQPQLEMGSWNELDHDEASFEAKHGPHPSHKDELVAKNVHESGWDPNAVMRAIEGSLPRRETSTDEVVNIHAAVADAHATLIVERDALLQQRVALIRQLAGVKRESRPLARRVLEASYNGVSLNMRVVAQRGSSDCDDESGAGCRSRSWLR